MLPSSRIRFKSRSVRPAGANGAEFTGDLTMNGVTQRATFVAVVKDGSRVSVSTHVQRSAFNMTALSPWSPTSQIDIQIEAG